jgi:hypothetical protein
MKSIVFAVAAALILAGAVGAGAAPTTMKDSGTFASKFAGNEIYDGAAFTNGWAKQGSSSMSFALNGPLLNAVNTSDGGSWIEGIGSTLDGGATTWSSGNDGDWTLEFQARFSALPNGFIMWLGASSDRILVEVHDTFTRDNGNTTFNVTHGRNTDGAFHAYRVANDSVANRYHVWRDAVLLTPPAGVGYDAANDDDRMILGDSTSSGSLYNGFNTDIDYVRYDQTGAYAPRVVIDNETGASNITDSGATLNGHLWITSAVPTTAIAFWGTADGGTNLAAWDNTNSFGTVEVGPLSTNLSLAEGTAYFYRFYASNAVETAWAPRTAEFAIPFGQLVTVAVTDHASEDGPDTGTFTLTRTKTNGQLAVEFAIEDASTAREGSDYIDLNPHSATFAAGQSNTTVTVTPIDDGFVLEDSETVVLSVRPGAGYSTGTPATASMDIAPGTDAVTWPYVPTGIEGSRLWLDASDLDGDGTADGLADSTPVALWTDKSGQGNDAAQATADLRPVVKTGALSGKPVLRFDGINDVLSAGTTTSFTSLHNGSGSTVLFVLRTNEDPADDTLRMALDTGANTGGIVGYGFGFDDRIAALTNALYFTINHGSGNVLNTLNDTAYNGVFPDDTWMLLDQSYARGLAGNDIVINKNGSEALAADPGVQPSTAPSARPLAIGAMGNGSFYLGGDIAEIIFYDKVLNSNELNYVGAYLEVKYGLDTTYSPGTTIVATRPATNITTTSAFLNGELVYEDSTPTTVKVFWGESDGGTDAGAWGNTNDLGQVPVDMLSLAAALTENKRYHYRHYATNDSGDVWADTSESFITGEIAIQTTDPNAAEQPVDTGAITISRPTALSNETMAVRLDYAGTATPGVDYIGNVRDVAFGLGETQKIVTLTPIDDWILDEGPETIDVTVAPGAYISAGAATVTISDSDRAVKRSSAFAYMYECNGTHPQNEDLDGVPGADWDFDATHPNRPVPWPGAPVQTVSNGVDVTHMSGAGGGVWQSGHFDDDFTVEVRLRAIGETNRPGNAYLGSTTLWATPAGTDLDTGILYVGPTSTVWGAGIKAHLGTDVNADGFHTFRMVRRKPANANVSYWVWRDGELLNPGGAGLPSSRNDDRDWMLLGDTAGNQFGWWELDYIRLEPGAWAWKKPTPPGTVLFIR